MSQKYLFSNSKLLFDVFEAKDSFCGLIVFIFGSNASRNNNKTLIMIVLEQSLILTLNSSWKSFS